MDKNTIIGMVLIAALLFGYSWYSQPSAEEQRAAFVQDSIAQAKKRELEKAQKANAAARKQTEQQQAAADTTALFHAAMQGEEQRVVLKNNKVEFTLNSKGATVERAVVKN